MKSNAPDGYKCPICAGLERRTDDPSFLIRPSDFVYQSELVSVLVNSFFIKNNPGHIIVVPNKHFESIYDLDDEYAIQIFRTAKKMALATKEAYECEGITVLQNNEPAGGQHAFHFHLHVFPRYKEDKFHINIGNKKLADIETRKKYADKIKSYL